MKLKKYLFKSVTSTNDIAIKKIKKNISAGIIIAQKQTKGRGRYGNKWIYLKNNLFMSIFFNYNLKISLRELTSISCKIVKKSLTKIVNKKITIKFFFIFFLFFYSYRIPFFFLSKLKRHPWLILQGLFLQE